MSSPDEGAKHGLAPTPRPGIAGPFRRPRLVFEQWPAAVYAIGDIHGCLEQLQALETAIATDAAGISGEKWIVTLGDYIDRGPASAATLDHIISPPPAGFRRFALAGNHEQWLLDFLADPESHLRWLTLGGIETALTYVPDASASRWRQDPVALANALARAIPRRHLEVLRALPTCLSLPGFFFVHAGIRPGIPLEEQVDQDLIWIRAPFTTANLSGNPTVVHGHTPVEAVEFAPGRIDIDTGCFHSGLLTALRVTPDGGLKVLQVRGSPSDFTPTSRRT